MTSCSIKTMKLSSLNAARILEFSISVKVTERQKPRSREAGDRSVLCTFRWIPPLNPTDEGNRHDSNVTDGSFPEIQLSLHEFRRETKPGLPFCRSPELSRPDVKYPTNRPGLLLSEVLQEHFLRARLRLSDKSSVRFQQALHSSPLMVAFVVKAVRPEEVGDSPGIEPVVRFEGHDPRPLAPVLVFRRRQAFADPPDRYRLFIFDANRRAPQNALDSMHAGRIGEILLHARILETCRHQHLRDLPRPLGTGPEVCISFAVEAEGLLDKRRLAP